MKSITIVIIILNICVCFSCSRNSKQSQNVRNDDSISNLIVSDSLSWDSFLKRIEKGKDIYNYYLSEYLKFDTSTIDGDIYQVSVLDVNYITDTIIAITVLHTYTGVSSKFEIMTFNNKGNKLYSQFVAEAYDRSPRKGEYEYSEFDFIDNKIIEVENFEILTVENNGELEDSILNESYKYYEIKLNGNIIKLSQNLKYSISRKYKEFSYRLITKGFLDKYTLKDLRIIRNEIFADYGYIFKSEDLRKYFSKEEWYHPSSEKVSDKLTDIEKMNIALILEREEELKKTE